jgi:hypothetical protein
MMRSRAASSGMVDTWVPGVLGSPVENAPADALKQADDILQRNLQPLPISARCVSGSRLAAALLPPTLTAEASSRKEGMPSDALPTAGRI